MVTRTHGPHARFASLLFAALIFDASSARARERWTPDEAASWQRKTEWLVGANYVPANAINQLEMWQAATWDPKTIDRELRLAASLGMNSMRVFLHDLVWQTEGGAYLRRIDEFLRIAARHRIGIMLVIFDSVWDPNPKPGPQPTPRPGVHNSGWVQSPGAAILRDPVRVNALEGYVKGVVGYFARDPRVHVWDLVNEPDNPNQGSYQASDLSAEVKASAVEHLLRQTFAWARAMNPIAPLTAGLWIRSPHSDDMLTTVDRLLIQESDVISFHHYGGIEELRQVITSLRRFGRPLLCTEYMARPKSTFDPILGELAREDIGAYNWGLVSGKSQTIFPWKSWQEPFTAEPTPWHHDIFRADGRPYDPTEVRYIRSVITKRRKRR